MINNQPLVLVGKCFTADWEGVNQPVLLLCKHLTTTSLCRTQTHVDVVLMLVTVG